MVFVSLFGLEWRRICAWFTTLGKRGSFCTRIVSLLRTQAFNDSLHHYVTSRPGLLYLSIRGVTPERMAMRLAAMPNFDGGAYSSTFDVIGRSYRAVEVAPGRKLTLCGLRSGRCVADLTRLSADVPCAHSPSWRFRA